MRIQIPYPNITAKDPEGKLMQVQSYLYQLAQQLNVALQPPEQANEETKR